MRMQPHLNTAMHETARARSRMSGSKAALSNRVSSMQAPLQKCFPQLALTQPYGIPITNNLAQVRRSAQVS